MSASTASPALTIAERRSLTAAESTLVDLLHTKASWVWTPENSVEPPDAPGNEQRAFRKTYTFPSDHSQPTNATILVAADDWLAMYVNGVLAHPTDPGHHYRTLLAFNVPLPVVEGEIASPMVLGFRVVNRRGRAGLIVAAQVNFEKGETDTFYTGMDQSWFGERLFQEHWEQPWFDSTPQASRWRPADVWPSTARAPSEPNLVREEIVVFNRLPEAVGGAVNGSVATPLAVDGGGKNGVGLSAGGVAGAFVGSILVALILGAVSSFIVAKKYYDHGDRARVRGEIEPFGPSREPGHGQMPGVEADPPAYEPVASQGGHVPAASQSNISASYLFTESSRS